MCNSIILKLEDISSIKRYFEFILSQTEKGEKFPIKLDDVFALVYSRKDKAVRALIDSDQFMQDIDYKVFPLNGGNSNGGRPYPGPSGGAGAIVKNMIPAFPFGKKE